MATNKTRKMRTSNRIPLTFSPEYIRHLKFKDFSGILAEEEISVARKLGIYKWDAWIKEKREKRRNRCLQIENEK